MEGREKKAVKKERSSQMLHSDEQRTMAESFWEVKSLMTLGGPVLVA